MVYFKATYNFTKFYGGFQHLPGVGVEVEGIRFFLGGWVFLIANFYGNL